MTALSRELIVAAKARADAATDWPWEAYVVPDERRKAGYVAVAAGDREVQVARYEGGFFDAEFIAAAREDVPVMADALLRVLDLHHEKTWRIESTVGVAKVSQGCAGCGGVWPCATVRAVTGKGQDR